MLDSLVDGCGLNGGLTVATFYVSTTLFGREYTALADLTGTIDSGLHYRLTAANPMTYLWAQDIGSVGQSGDGADISENPKLSGIMAGFNTFIPSSSCSSGCSKNAG